MNRVIVALASDAKNSGDSNHEMEDSTDSEEEMEGMEESEVL